MAKKTSKTKVKAKKPAKKPVAKKAAKKVAKKTVVKAAPKPVVEAPRTKGNAKPLARMSATIPKGRESQKVESLLRLGKERGYITYDEILREFPTIEDNVVMLEEMYERFTAAGVDVLEGGGMLDDTGADEILEKKKLQNRRSDAGYDSVQMYLREIGQYPLLNGLQEKDLAKRILAGDEEARSILARSNLRLASLRQNPRVSRPPCNKFSRYLRHFKLILPAAPV
jgi:RNA polymerase primary sigma factor